MLNLTAVNLLAHDLESLLDLARQNKLPIDSNIINLILEGGDTLKQFTLAIEAQLNGVQPRAPIVIPTSQLIARVQRVVQSVGKGSPVAAETACEASAPIPSAPRRRSHPSRPPPSRESRLPPSQSGAIRPPSPPARPAAVSGQVATGGAAMVKVTTQKLDALVDLVGEMVIAQSLVAQDPAMRTVTHGTLARNLSQLGRITDELQKIAMSLRMVPIRSTFQKMNRLVRDLAGRQNKQVDLCLHGEDTELDRTIVEQLNDPLVHMIRNAVDHGIEKPDVRLARGKPPRDRFT